MKQFAKVLSASLALLCGAAVAQPSNSEVDVVGIRFGMSPDQVMEALKKNSAGTKVTRREKYVASPGIQEGLAQLTACSESDPGSKLCLDEITVIFTAGTQEAFQITRQVMYGGKLRQEDLKVALEKKYGFVQANFNHLFTRPVQWVTGAMALLSDGKIVYGDFRPGGCDTGYPSGLTRAVGNCVWSMETHGYPMSPRQDLVDSHKLSIASHQTLFRSLKIEQAAREAATKAHNADLDKQVQRGAPKL